MPGDPDEPVSAKIMSRLLQEARDNGSVRRLGTLARLKEACDDIISGRALELAREKNWPLNYFHPHRRLVARSVHEYRRLRQYISPRTEEPGPTKDTIAHDDDLSSYLRARDEERKDARPPSRRGTRALRSDEIIMAKLEFSEQAIVRAELEEGRLARLRFNTLAAFFHKLSGVDLQNRESFSFEDVSREIKRQIANDDRLAIADLVARLHDNRFLAGIGLQYEPQSGRVMTDIGDLVLVPANELRVLVRLSGLNPDNPENHG
ncbi:hypothetical protein [Rhizobium ruizarguesonis]|uniref:hypothetical protein n=1 Tax=Rhizobium ruizarguesonis TaxID=2081791 RepID=UPI0010316CDF|nr:hypothetical protein [Rhizobium ruizarguesonis]TAZ42052.1 hypothetical protein ELH74_22845 [Rhizobium ruizarguesonis]TBA06361.1 hypothetical protein ELH64_18830 [Rhizobium ruizarguesonis]